jgi:hypothetical protein
MATIKSLLNGSEIPAEKPSTLTDWDWDIIKSFEALIAQTKDIETKKPAEDIALEEKWIT